MPTEAAGSVSFDDTDSDGVADAEPETKDTVVVDGVTNAGESLGRLHFTYLFRGNLWLSIVVVVGRKQKTQEYLRRRVELDQLFPGGYFSKIYSK